MTCRTSRRSRPAHFAPNYNNLINEFFNTAVGDVVQKVEKRHFTNPATNVIERDDKFELQVALPGFSKKDVSILIEDDVLKVSSAQEDATDKNYRLREFNYATFTKHFKLPESVDQSQIKADFKEGILNIELGKKAEAIPQPPTSITIK